MPPGVKIETKAVFGADDSHDSCMALVEGLRKYPELGIWHLELMLIRPTHCSAGLGSVLYREVEALARSSGAIELRLCVSDQSPAPLRFWRRQDYQFRRAVHARRRSISLSCAS